MNEKEEVLVRVQQYPGRGWDWDDIVELDVTFDEFMDTICRAAHQHGKDGLPYDGRLGKVWTADTDEDGNIYEQKEGWVDKFDPWNHF